MKIQIPALLLSSCANYDRLTLNVFQASDPHLHLSLINKLHLLNHLLSFVGIG